MESPNPAKAEKGVNTYNMKCPKCNEQAIPFQRWGSGLNAFNYNCDSCGVRLKANSTTKYGFIATITVTVAAFVAIILLDADPSRGSLIRFLGLFVPIFIGAAVTYVIGGYHADEAD